MPVTEVPLHASHHVLDNERWIEVARRHVNPEQTSTTNMPQSISYRPTHVSWSASTASSMESSASSIPFGVSMPHATPVTATRTTPGTKSLRRASPFSAQELASEMCHRTAHL